MQSWMVALFPYLGTNWQMMASWTWLFLQPLVEWVLWIMAASVLLTLTLNLIGWLVTCYLVRIRIFSYCNIFKKLSLFLIVYLDMPMDISATFWAKIHKVCFFFFQTSRVYTKHHNCKGLRKRTKHKKYSEIQAHNQCSNQWADLIQHEKRLQNKSVACRKHYLVTALQDTLHIPLREALGR